MPARRSGGSIDFTIARAFSTSIPRGRWAAYGDVAAAAGAPRGAQAVGSWLAHNEIDVPDLLYRVINVDGRVNAGYESVNWPGLPETSEDVRRLLVEEGVEFDSRARASQLQRWTAASFRPPS